MVIGSIEFCKSESILEFIQSCCDLHKENIICEYNRIQHKVPKGVYAKIFSEHKASKKMIAIAYLDLDKEARIILTCGESFDIAGPELAVRMLADYAFNKGYETVYSDGHLNGTLSIDLYKNIGFIKNNDKMELSSIKFYSGHC